MPSCRRLAALVVLVASAGLWGCGSGGSDDTRSGGELSATELEATSARPPADAGGARETEDGTTSTAGSADPTGGQVVPASAVTCELTSATDPAVADPTPCDQPHDTETFELTGTGDLDDCYRAVAASSDVAVGVDPFEDTELDFTDDRISGHSFSAIDREVTCTVFLADPSPTQLIGR
jgi:hypothetical protein